MCMSQHVTTNYTYAYIICPFSGALLYCTVAGIMFVIFFLGLFSDANIIQVHLRQDGSDDVWLMYVRESAALIRCLQKTQLGTHSDLAPLTYAHSPSMI